MLKPEAKHFISKQFKQSLISWCISVLFWPMCEFTFCFRVGVRWWKPSSGVACPLAHRTCWSWASPSACEPPFMLSVLGGKADGETEREKKKLCVLKRWVEYLSPVFARCITYLFTRVEAVRLMKYDSQLISVEHRRSIPHQRWLLKYSQLPAAQKPFYTDKKHVTFNLSDASLLSHVSFAQCTEKL